MLPVDDRAQRLGMLLSQRTAAPTGPAPQPGVAYGEQNPYGAPFPQRPPMQYTPPLMQPMGGGVRPMPQGQWGGPRMNTPYRDAQPMPPGGVQASAPMPFAPNQFRGI